MGTLVAKKTTVRADTGTTVAAAVMLAVGALASSLTIGLLAALPLLQQAKNQTVRMMGDWESAPKIIKEIPLTTEFNPYAYEATENGWDGEAFDIQLVPDGGYIIVGTIKVNTEKKHNQPYLLKIYGENAPKPDDLLKKEWSVVVPTDANAAARSVTLAFDKKDPATRVHQYYVIAGHIAKTDRNIDAFVGKYATNGEPQPVWFKTYGQEKTVEFVYSVQQVFNERGEKDGFVITGIQIDSNSDQTKILTLKTDDSGNLDASWSPNPKTYELSPIGRDGAYAVRQTFSPDGTPDGYVLAGTTAQTRSNLDAMLVKLTRSGVIDAAAWPANGAQKAGARTFGANREENGHDVEIKLDGNGQPTGYILGGYGFSFNPNQPDAATPYLVVVDRRGQTVLEKTFPAAYSATYAVEQTFNGNRQPNGYVLAGKYDFGASAIDMFAIRTDATGEKRWISLTPGMDTDVANAVKQTPNRGFILAGKTYSQLYTIPPEPKPSNLYVVLYAPEKNPPPPEEPPSSSMLFRRADADASGTTLDLADPIFTLTWLFLAGNPAPCQDAADVNDDGIIDLADAITTLTYLFLGGGIETIPPPGPIVKGTDPTADALGCESYP